ncbi:hypothetical protein [Flavobacterium chungnamense]|uniref:DUF1574 domain-containing protein n=1 Tax=Flavobacterium chungnamense TaxID=706182 RepID=A0ABP7UVU9_9FLAO
MKKNLINVLLFLILFFGIDFTIGIVAKNSVLKLKTGFLGVVNNTIKDTSKILILGSSRAQNHYNSELISKKCNLSTFNGGQGGYGTLYTHAVLNERLKESSPQLVILDIAPNILVDEKQFEKLTSLMPLCSLYPSFSEIVKKNPDNKEITFWINTLKYNSTLFDLFYDKFAAKKKDGYTALPQSINLKTFVQFYYKPELFSNEMKIKINTILSSQLEYVTKMKKLCDKKGVQFLVIISPSYIDYDKTNKIKNKLFDYLKNNQIQVINFTESNLFSKNPELFHDQLHLNVKGATFFSNQVVDSLNVKYLLSASKKRIK